MTALQPPLADATDLAKFASRDPDAISAQVSAAIRAYCGWHVCGLVTETMTRDGRGGRFLALPTGRISSISAVTSDGVTVASTDYDWSESGYLQLVHNSTLRCFSYRPRGITVTLIHGLDTIPDDLVSVVASISLRAVASPNGAIREEALSQKIFYANITLGVSGGIALLQHEKELLTPYKLPPSTF